MRPQKLPHRPLGSQFAHASMNRAAAHHAWVELNLAERTLISGDVLLQYRHQCFGLLRAEINALKISHFHLRFRLLLQGPENKKKVPDVHPNLNAIGVALAVIVGVQ